MTLSPRRVARATAAGCLAFAALAAPARADLNFKTGLSFWLDATTGVTTNASGQVTAWADRAGQGHTVASVTGTPTLVQSALFGQPAVYFSGNAELPINGQVVTNTQSYTFFAVASDTGGTGGGFREIISNWTSSNGGQSYFLGTASSSGANRTFRFTDSIGGAGDTAATQVGVLPTATPAAGFLETGLSTPAGSSLFVDTPMTHLSTAKPIIPTRSTTATWRVGSQGAAGERWVGYISEVLVYDAALTDPQRDLVYNYLAVKYHFQLPGDANRDSLINADDYTLLDRGFAQHLTGWTNGDFNSDGTVDQNDYLLLDIAFGQAHGLSPDVLSERESQFGADYVSQLLTSIPEPSSLAACGLALLPLVRRRAVQ